MKKILLLLLVLLVPLSALGELRDEIIRKEWVFEGKKMFLCYDGNCVYYLRDENLVFLAWFSPKDLASSYCLTGEDEIYVINTQYMFGAYTVSASYLLRKIKRSVLNTLPAVPVNSITNARMSKLARSSEKALEEIPLNLPRGNPRNRIYWYFHIKNEKLIASFNDGKEALLKKSGIEYYLYDAQKNGFIPISGETEKNPDASLQSPAGEPENTPLSDSDSQATTSPVVPASLAGTVALLAGGGISLWAWRRRKRSRDGKGKS